MANAIADQARSDAVIAGRRRKQARSTGSVANPITVAAIDFMQTEMVATPSDLVALVRDQWPDLWARVRVEARRQRQSPIAQLIAAIEAGLPGEAAHG